METVTNKKLRVTDIIKEEDIIKWKHNDIITISAGCGVGKSYFIKNIVYEIAKVKYKRILMLVHRSNCLNQFELEIKRDKKTDIIDIKTYQHFEFKELRQLESDLSQYEYIVCDEFHYFLDDSSFNKTTDLSLELILQQTNAIIIFMSATCDTMKNFITNVKNVKTINYVIPPDYSFIDMITFFNKDESIEEFIKEAISKNQKGIFFIQSVKKAYKLYNKYKNYSLFNCSKSNEKYKYVDEDKIKNMLINERFEELILITTSSLDAGVNIIDRDLKHIVVDIKDISSLIQCIGRKRIQDSDDKVSLYIKTITNQQLGGMETNIRKKIKMADYFRTHNLKEFIEKYPREHDTSNILYDMPVDNNTSTKKLNELMYTKNKLDIARIQIMKTHGKFGYCKYLATTFGFYDNKTGIGKYRLINENYNKDELSKYLDSLIGKKLDRQMQKGLITRIDHKVDGKQLKSHSSLNKGLKMINLPYIIIPKRTKLKRYWKIEKYDW